MDQKFFKQIPFFAQLSDEKIEVVSKAFEAKRFQKGDVVMHQDDPADGMYVIIFGEVEVEIDKKIITNLEGNDFFGEMALVANEPRSATIRVISDDLSTFFLGKVAFENIKDELGENVKRELLQRIIENYEQ